MQAIILLRHFPTIKMHALTCHERESRDPAGNRVHRQVLSFSGPSYASSRTTAVLLQISTFKAPTNDTLQSAEVASTVSSQARIGEAYRDDIETLTQVERVTEFCSYKVKALRDWECFESGKILRRRSDVTTCWVLSILGLHSWGPHSPDHPTRQSVSTISLWHPPTLGFWRSFGLPLSSIGASAFLSPFSIVCKYAGSIAWQVCVCCAPVGPAGAYRTAFSGKSELCDGIRKDTFVDRNGRFHCMGVIVPGLKWQCPRTACRYYLFFTCGCM
jgi:hypothetical protein